MAKIGSLVLAFFKDGITFFVLGFILTLPLELIGGVYAKEAEAIFMESMAPRTIMALSVLSTMVASLAVIWLGTHDQDDKLNDAVYKYVVFKITSFSMSFSSAGTGMLLGLSAAAVINSKFNIAILVFITSVIFFLYWAYFEGINQICKTGFGSSISSKLTKLILVLTIVAAPAIYAFSYEPVKECSQKPESNNKLSQQNAGA